MNKKQVQEWGVGFAITATIAGLLAIPLYDYLATHEIVYVYEGERYELLTPMWLMAVLFAPFVVWGALRSLADLPRFQLFLAILLRVVLVGTLALTVARIAKSTESTNVSTIYLVDVSDSVTDEAIEDARTAITDAIQHRGENDVRVVTFARDARVLPIEEEATEAPAIARHREPEDAGAGSNLQAALQLSYGLFPPGHLRRVVLFSDGGQTHGDLLAESSRAARFKVKLFYHANRHGAPREVAMRELTVPDRVKVGDPFHVRARVFSSRATKARIRLYQGETINGLDGVRDVELAQGDNEVEFDSVVRVAGPVTYRAELEPEAAPDGQSVDRFSANNRFATTVVVPGRPTVLYVEGAAGRGSYLASALNAADYEVDVRTPRAIPTSLAELERFDFFILSDVSADQVSLSQQDAIERYVKDLGGGFMMAGGENSYGLGGWQGTRIEQLLPVRMDAERRRDQPSLALALVMDKSGSMSGQKIELAKEAAKATAGLLGPDDYIEVVGFDSTPTRIVRMQSAANRVAILRDIGRLQARGGTNIFPALDMAYQDLANTRARIKHVILLTDGQAPETGIPELVQAMRIENITVSIVGLGTDVNRPFLQSIANLGGGRAYFTTDPHNIPRIFMRETTTVARSSAVEEYFQPQVVSRADFLRGIEIGSSPYLHGYVATRMKPAPAQLILQSELGEPILARWRPGLGWALAWTSDVKNRWAVEWLRWPAFSRFFAQLVREHSRQKRRYQLDMRAEILGDEAHVVVDAVGQDDQFMNGLDSTVTIEGPMTAPSRDRQRTELPLRQTAPGRYEARFPLREYGSFVLTATHKRDDAAVAESVAQLANPYPREYMTLEPDLELLSRAAAITGGREDPTVEQVFDPGDEKVTFREEQWPKLIYLALGLFLIDLLLRRVRIFDRKFRSAPSFKAART